MTDMADDPKTPKRWHRPAYGVESDLDYIRQRQEEMAHPRREERYRPGWPASPHSYHERKAVCTCGRADTLPCTECDATICAHCGSAKEST